jgi:transposase
MGCASKYPDELRERAVRMVAEVRPQYPSQWAAITAVAGMLGSGTPETLRTWIRRSEVYAGLKPGVTSQMAEENKALRREIAELRTNTSTTSPPRPSKNAITITDAPTESGVIQHNQSPDLPGRLNPPWNCCAAFGCR